MELRDKLRERAQKLLEPGEEIQEIFLAQTGPNPIPFMWFGGVFFTSYEVVVATDRAVVVMSAGRWSSSFPKAVIQRLPRDTQLGPVSGGMYAPINLPGDKTTRVHTRWYKDVEAADAGRGASRADG